MAAGDAALAPADRPIRDNDARASFRPIRPATPVSEAARGAPDVPIWRAWRLSSADVLCARSVRGGQAQIGSSGCL
jgi:hypothetical protein